MNVRKLLTSLVCAGIAVVTSTSATNVTPTTENVTTETESTIEAKTETTETATEIDNLYPTCGIVTEVTSTEMVFTDFNGNEWVIVGDPEDWCKGDIVSAIMSDNCTPETIYDDIIVQTRYCGWVY